MEIKEIKRLISSKSKTGILGRDNELSDEPKGANFQNSSGFNKKFFSKHGWDFIIMQK